MTVPLARVAAGTTPVATAAARLTTDQRLLLGLLAEGYTQAAVGHRLGLTAAAVEQRASTVYRRLGARNAPHAVAIAYRAGLLPVPQRPATRP